MIALLFALVLVLVLLLALVLVLVLVLVRSASVSVQCGEVRTAVQCAVQVPVLVLVISHRS